MASLSSAKTLGEVGGILVFFPFLSLVGWVLILLAVKEISDSGQDKTIFDDALIAAITAIIGAVALGVFLATGAFGALIAFGGLAFGTAGVLAAVSILAAFQVFAIISAFFLKRSYEKISKQLNISAFATAGLLYLIGAALTIVLVGFLIIFIALIFQVVAYFSIQDRPAPYAGFQPRQQTFTPSRPITQPPAPQQPLSEFKFCHKCGAKIAGAADYCPNCGAKQS